MLSVFKEKYTKSSISQCNECKSHPGLCPAPCFEILHTRDLDNVSDEELYTFFRKMYENIFCMNTHISINVSEISNILIFLCFYYGEYIDFA